VILFLILKGVSLVHNAFQNPPSNFFSNDSIYLVVNKVTLPAPPTRLNPPLAPIRSWFCPLRQKAASGAVPLSHLQGETSNKTQAETG